MRHGRACACIYHHHWLLVHYKLCANTNMHAGSIRHTGHIYETMSTCAREILLNCIPIKKFSISFVCKPKIIVFVIHFSLLYSKVSFLLFAILRVCHCFRSSRFCRIGLELFFFCSVCLFIAICILPVFYAI